MPHGPVHILCGRSRTRLLKHESSELVSRNLSLLKIAINALLVARIYELIYLIIAEIFLESPLAVLYIEVYKHASHIKDNSLYHVPIHFLLHNIS